MNLLLVTNLFPTPFDPERGVFTYQLVKRLRQHCDLTVVCPLPWFPSGSPWNKLQKYREFSEVPGEYFVEDIKVYSPKYILIPKVSERFHARLMTIGIRRCIKMLHRKFHFDAVNSQWLYPDSVAVDEIARDLGIPHISTGLGCDINEYINQNSIGNQVMDTLHHASGITVVSNSLKSELEKRSIPSDKISVIHNGVDSDQFRLLDKAVCRKALDLKIDDPMFLYVGRLSPEKSVETLIRAAATVLETGQLLRLYLVGDGPERVNLVQLAEILGISPQVKFVGKVEHDKIGPWMGSADYVCLPSIREGCPNVILEALGCGRPVVASHVGAIPDIVTNQSGVLFTPGDTNGLSQAMITAINTPWHDVSIQSTILGLSWEKAAQRYQAAFENAIQNSGQADTTAT